MILGALIGVVGGLGAIAFYTALEIATHLFLALLVGLTPPSPTGEGGAPITDAVRPWALPLVVGLGGLISGIIVFRFAPEAEGHGTDAAIAAYHHHPRGIRGRIPLVKLVSSAVTIGSGGSGGREGPTAQISAGFGSYLSRLLDLDARDARIAVAVGMAAGIGAIFRAPLGGAVLGAELLYREDVESEVLVPSFIATIIAYSIFGSVVGFEPIFGAQARFGFSDPRQLGWYAVIGLACGAVGLLYIRNFYGFMDGFGRLRIPRILKPAIGGFIVGCIGLMIPGVLGTGYGFVQAGLDRQTLLAIPLWMVLILPFAKIVATSLSIGSGGSGGIFGPGMFIGGMLGAGIWRLLEPVAPAIPADPAPFIIVAMMALFGSVAHAPLAVMLMVAEMTGNLSMLAPAMVAVGLATFVVGSRTIYRSQLATRADSPAHRYRFAMPLLAAVSIGDAARQPRLVVGADESVADVRNRIEAAGVPGAPVVDGDGRVVGMADLRSLAGVDDQARIESLISLASRSSRAATGLTMPWGHSPITTGRGRRSSPTIASSASCRSATPWLPIGAPLEATFVRCAAFAPVASSSKSISIPRRRLWVAEFRRSRGLAMSFWWPSSVAISSSSRAVTCGCGQRITYRSSRHQMRVRGSRTSLPRTRRSTRRASTSRN